MFVEAAAERAVVQFCLCRDSRSAMAIDVLDPMAWINERRVDRDAQATASH